jgi:hypothetical protein
MLRSYPHFNNHPLKYVFVTTEKLNNLDLNLELLQFAKNLEITRMAMVKFN